MRNKAPETFQTVSGGLRILYRTKLFPLEATYLFHDLHSAALEDAEFEKKPTVLVVGQYSTGKTTFVRHLLEQDYPGMCVGPEPTTDSFIVLMEDEHERVIPGNAVVLDSKMPFGKLKAFGNAFLRRFTCIQMPHPILKSINIIDTPGILAGVKQRKNRGYDFAAVLRWFAERADRIILMFDAYKMDIPDELSEVIGSLKDYEGKMRIVLNKADQISTQQLMRVYGALMWSLGKIICSPEVVRVYIGSFWSQPLVFPDNRKLFEAEEQDLFSDIQSLPRNAALHKLHDFIKRARLAKVNGLIISSLKEQMPSVFRKDTKKKDLIENLAEIYQKIQKEHHIPPSDFPDIKKMQTLLQDMDFSKFAIIKPRLIDAVNDMLTYDLPRLLASVHQEEAASPAHPVMGGAFDRSMSGPFNQSFGLGINEGIDQRDWVVKRDKAAYDAIFETLPPVNGRVSGTAAKKEMLKSNLPTAVLGRIWDLSDVDKDGFLDDEEFALANHLIKLVLEGHNLPPTLPGHLVPPSKRRRAPRM